MRTRDEHKEQALRQKTIEMIVQGGLDGFGVNKLAKAVGVSPATIYIYFKDREDLIVQVCLEVSSKMLTASLKNFDPEMHFEEGLKVQWINRANFFMQYPLEVQFIEHVRYSHLYEKVTTLLTEQFRDIMSRFLRNAIERKELVPLPFEVYWSVAFAPLYQLIKFHTQGQSFVNQHFTLTEEIKMKAFQLVLKALTP